MKTLIILVLIVALCGALFFTRPTKADFERYVHEETKVVDGKATGGKTIAGKIQEQLKTLVADTANKSAADVFLSQCDFENDVLWTNVKKDGKLIYTGMLNHWFERQAK